MKLVLLVRVLKSRYTGDTGIATHLFYDKDTGRLSEISMEVEEQDEIELLEKYMYIEIEHIDEIDGRQY